MVAAPVLGTDSEVGEGLEEVEGGGIGGVWCVVWIASEGVDGVTPSPTRPILFSISSVTDVVGGLSEVEPGVRSADDDEVGEGAEDARGDRELCVWVMRCEDEAGDVG